MSENFCLDTHLKVRRDELIRRLVSRQVALALQDKNFIANLYLHGAQLSSYHSLSDDALAQEYEETYGQAYDFESPAPSPLDRLLTDAQREDLVGVLIEHEIDALIGSDGELHSALKKGWQGFEHMSDERLLDRYAEIFEERHDDDPRAGSLAP